MNIERARQGATILAESAGAAVARGDQLTELTHDFALSIAKQLAEACEELDALTEAGLRVITEWDGGDLAGAVRELSSALGAEA